MIIDHYVFAGDNNTQQKLGRRGKVNINETWNVSCVKSVKWSLQFEHNIFNVTIILY